MNDLLIIERGCLLGIEREALHAERLLLESDIDAMFEDVASTKSTINLTSSGAPKVAPRVKGIWARVERYFNNVRARALAKKQAKAAFEEMCRNSDNPIIRTYRIDVKYLDEKTIKKLSEVSEKAERICKRVRNLQPLSSADKDWLIQMNDKIASDGIDSIIAENIEEREVDIKTALSSVNSYTSKYGWTVYDTAIDFKKVYDDIANHYQNVGELKAKGIDKNVVEAEKLNAQMAILRLKVLNEVHGTLKKMENTLWKLKSELNASENRERKLKDENQNLRNELRVLRSFTSQNNY